MSGGLRVLSIVENNPFPDDVRVRQEAEALTASGHKVTVIAPARAGQPPREVISGVTVRRYQPGPEASGAAGYAVEYGVAALQTLRLSMMVLLRGGFDVVHVHNPPDAMVAVCGLYRLLGKKIVFDHHDAGPEMYQTLFGQGEGLPYKALRLTEWLACRLAHHVISTNTSMKQLVVSRNGVDPDRVTVVRNGPDLRLFTDPVEREANSNADGDDGLPTASTDEPSVLCYVGSMGHHDGLGHLMRSVRHLVDLRGIGSFKCLLVGSGSAVPELEQLRVDLELTSVVEFVGQVPYTEVAQIVESADVCIAPEPRDSYNELCTVIKLMEYMACGKPIVAFDLPEHRVTAGGAALYAQQNDEAEMAANIDRLLADPALRVELGNRGRQRVVDQLAWEHQAKSLVDVYEALASKTGIKGGANGRRLRASNRAG